MGPAPYAVIGDLVGSRRLPNRGAAQATLGEVLERVNVALTPLQPFEPTVGDEFQGVFATLADAILGSLLVRLDLLPAMDARFGIGCGEVSVHDATRRPLLQDGPGWWGARDAIEGLARRRTRTRYAGKDAAPVTAFLTTRDALVERLSDRGRRMLALSLTGVSQREIAERERISPSAVSQQFARGIAAVRDAQDELAGKGRG